MNENWREYRTPWGQDVLVSEHFKTVEKPDGTYIFPQGDTTVPPSGHMPRNGYFFDSIVRQPEIDEDNLLVVENLDEFSLMSPTDGLYCYLARQRVQHACWLLEATDQSMEEIAQACGLGGAFYFARVFSKAMGLPPSAYRRRTRT